MNVLFVVPWDNIGGVAHVVNRVAHGTRARGHGAYLLLPGDEDRVVASTSREGFPMFSLRLRSPSTPDGSMRSRIAFALTLPLTLLLLARLIRRLDVDIVNVHYPIGESYYFAILRRLGLVRLVTSVHGADLLPYGDRCQSHQNHVLALLAASDAVVAPSQGYHTEVRAVWPEIEVDSRVIPNGIDPEELGCSTNGPEVPTSAPVICSILHLVHYKGADVLIRAFAKLATRYPGVTLRLISDGPQRVEFERLSAALGVADRVHFLGYLNRDGVRSELQGCAVFVLPSRTESFGSAAAKAVALDRAIGASRIGGLPELIEDEVSGVLVPPGDVDALERALSRLLDDPALRRALGTAAGRRVRRDFLWDRTCTLYSDLFNE